MRICFMRVDSDAGPDIRLALGHGNDRAPLTLARRDIEEAADATLPCIGQNLVLTFGEALIIEMAVAIDQPHASCSSSSGSSSRGNSGVGCARRNSLSARGEYQGLRMPSNVRSSAATPIEFSKRSALSGMIGRMLTAR